MIEKGTMEDRPVQNGRFVIAGAMTSHDDDATKNARAVGRAGPVRSRGTVIAPCPQGAREAGTMHDLHGGIAFLRSGHADDAKDLAIDSMVRVLDPTTFTLPFCYALPAMRRPGWNASDGHGRAKAKLC